MPLVKKKNILKKSNDVETQTDDVFVNDDQQLGSETNELFVLKTKWLKETTKKTIEIHDFINKIEDQDNNKKKIVSPKFKIAGVEFSIWVYTDESRNDAPGFIGVYLHNYSNEDQMSSVTAKGSGVEASWEMTKVPAGKGFGRKKFMTHEKYREWAKVHGDVFKLDVVVTLHTKAEGDDWTR